MSRLDEKRAARKRTSAGRKYEAEPSSNGDGNPHKDPPPARFASRRLDKVVARDVRWLWPGRIPYGMLSIIDGDPSHGKSLITLDLGARLTRGGPMPFCRDQFTPGGVLIIAAEDAVEETIKPRMVTAGCDESLVHVAETVRLGEYERPIRLPDDFTALEWEIRERKISLVVIDPLLGFLSQAVDSHKDQSVRDVLHQLKLVVERTGAAVIGLRHMNKSGGHGNPMYRGIASIAIVAAARAAFAVDYHPNDKNYRVFAPTKVNICAMPKSLTYRIEDEMGQPVIRWGDECEVTAADLGAKLVGIDNAKTEAVEFLRDLLSGGRMPQSDVLSRAEAAGIKERTLKRAKSALAVRSYKTGFSSSTWVWELPTEEGQPIPD